MTDSKFWTTREGKKIKWPDLPDDHLKNIIGMLTRNSHPSLKYALNEEYAREIVELLKLNQAKLTWWLLSSNKKMRELAQRANK